jgi:hypothetical protein
MLLFAFTGIYVAAFHAARPKGVDIAVVATPAQAAQLQTALDLESRGAFDVRRYDTEAAARTALLDTDAHGVLVRGPAHDTILVAQALGAAPTETVTTALQHVAVDADTHDLRPLPSSDRRGLSSLFTVVGTLIPSLVFGVLLSVFGRALPARVRWAAVLAYGVGAGLVVAFNGEVRFAPRLPYGWLRLRFRVAVRGQLIEVDMSPKGTRYTLVEGTGIQIAHDGVTRRLRPDVPVVARHTAPSAFS